jgi:hypothetical protein
MAFLKRRHLSVSALLGGVFGPLSYLAGAKVGAAEWVSMPLNFAVLGGAWVIALPFLVWLARRAERLTSQTA